MIEISSHENIASHVNYPFVREEKCFARQRRAIRQPRVEFVSPWADIEIETCALKQWRHKHSLLYAALFAVPFAMPFAICTADAASGQPARDGRLEVTMKTPAVVRGAKYVEFLRLPLKGD